MSTTEKVRVRGLVERTRITIVDVAGKGRSVIDAESTAKSDDNMTIDDVVNDDEKNDDHDNDDDDDITTEGTDVEGNHGRWEMEVARVYERTLVEMGTSLENDGGVGLG